MEIKINVDAAIENVRKTAEKVLNDKMTHAARGVTTILLCDGRNPAYGEEGLAHEIIRKKIEEYVLSEQYGQMIDRLIEIHVEEEATKAVKTLLNSKTRKHLFKTTSPVESERDSSEWVIIQDGVPYKMAWSNTFGWVEFSDEGGPYETYGTSEKKGTTLPMGGMWYQIQSTTNIVQEEYKWLIAKIGTPNLVWDLEFGWVDRTFESGDKFTDTEREKCKIPEGGYWILEKDFMLV